MSIIQKPKKNVLYKRKDIQDMYGGELQTYLPQNNKIILAGCFCIELNPDAPVEIQVGNAPKVTQKALLLSMQPDTVFPVFLKEYHSDRHYSFEGYFKFKSISNEPSVISEAEGKSGRYDELSHVLKLQRV